MDLKNSRCSVYETYFTTHLCSLNVIQLRNYLVQLSNHEHIIKGIIFWRKCTYVDLTIMPSSTMTFVSGEKKYWCLDSLNQYITLYIVLCCKVFKQIIIFLMRVLYKHPWINIAKVWTGWKGWKFQTLKPMHQIPVLASLIIGITLAQYIGLYYLKLY